MRKQKLAVGIMAFIIGAFLTSMFVDLEAQRPRNVSIFTPGYYYVDAANSTTQDASNLC